MLVWQNYSSLNEYLRQFPQSHDEHMTQTVSNMVSTISFDIWNHRKNIRPSNIFDNFALNEVIIRRSDHSTKTFDEVSFNEEL